MGKKGKINREEREKEMLRDHAMFLSYREISKFAPRFDPKMISHFFDQYKVFSIADNYRGKSENFEKYFLEKIKPGDFLTEEGKKMILSKSLYEKKDLGKTVGDLFNGFFPSVQERIQIKKLRQSGAKGFLKSYIPFTKERQLLRGRYLDRTTSAFRDLHKLMQGDYAKRMPELAKAVTDVYDAGFFDVAAKILYEGKLLNPWKYGMLQRQIHKRAEAGVKYTTRTLESYVMPQKVAAIVLGIIGIGSLVINNSITGNVVGVSNPNIFGLLGGVLLLVSAGLLFFKKKKQIRYKIKRKKNIKKKKRKSKL
ncbi:MAG: LPXTG cell wall anchor domain-containing protein [Candidatus Nanoarchaeia archaeon]|nr:LPXTG cell wall anchor domain-containing protein [Candidatus Nanoarchaeia archaeon]MDD5740693.1 LPXTG cell wall anchor domain-containing protein [Candidatus Nanoarchaeia archaeon]